MALKVRVSNWAARQAFRFLPLYNRVFRRYTRPKPVWRVVEDPETLGYRLQKVNPYERY